MGRVRWFAQCLVGWLVLGTVFAAALAIHGAKALASRLRGQRQRPVLTRQRATALMRAVRRNQLAVLDNRRMHRERDRGE